jgi:hypothetical protein
MAGGLPPFVAFVPSVVRPLFFTVRDRLPRWNPPGVPGTYWFDPMCRMWPKSDQYGT